MLRLPKKAIHSHSWLNSGGKIVLADGLDSGVTALRIQPAHDAVDVILDGEFGKMHGFRDFLISETTRQ